VPLRWPTIRPKTCRTSRHPYWRSPAPRISRSIRPTCSAWPGWCRANSNPTPRIGLYYRFAAGALRHLRGPRETLVWTALFLATMILTSVAGFPSHPCGFDPPRALGVISSALLAAAVAALHGFRLASAWRWIYIGGALAALYFNVFVGVIQAFQKLSFLQSLAPPQSEAPFVIAQLAVLVIFDVFGVFAVVKFHPHVKTSRREVWIQ
jgi:hypothetical protein